MWPLPPYQFELYQLRRQELEKEAKQERLARRIPRRQQIYDGSLAWLGRGLIIMGEWLQRQAVDEALQPRLQRQP